MIALRLRRAAHDEHGALLIEILVSALLLVMLTGGAIAAFDSASHQSGEQRSQAVAANLAATEMERLRTIKFASLEGLDVTHPPKDVDGTAYTIRSQTADAFDPAAAGSGCDTSSRSPQALRATTTVTWPDMGGRAPVKLESIIAAPASASSTRGSLSVQVLDKDGLGVTALPIALTGPSNVSGNTDDNGCVRFTDLVPGNGYHLKYSRPDWVATPGGVQDVDELVSIVPGTTATKSYQYDPAARVTARFYAKRDNGAKDNKASAQYDAPVGDVTWTHASLPGGRVTQPVSPASHQVTSIVLAASATPYGVYADNCAAATPAPARPADSVLSPDGSAAIQVPNLRVVLKFSGALYAGARVIATTDCGARYDLGLTDAAGVAQGGVPFGTNLVVCVAGSSGGFVGHANKTAVNNDHYDHDNDVTMDVKPSGVLAGGCP